MERLVVCQGTAQLVTAVAVLQQHIERTGCNEAGHSSRVHLLICGLGVPESQAEEFVSIIRRMADLLYSFSTISVLSDARLEQLLGDARHASGAVEIARLLHCATGIGSVDEVFTVRDWQSCNLLVLSAYPDATHICYGDSIGVYLPRSSVSKTTVRSMISDCLGRLMAPRSALLSKPRLDVSYLLLPGAFGAPSSGDVVRTDVKVLRNLFGRLAPLLSRSALAKLRQRIEGRPVWVLMGSNFSEQGIMTPQAEISAYFEWISSLCPDPEAILLVKSHPRDRKGKGEMFQQHLQEQFSEVLNVDSIGSAYLPVETLLLAIKPIVSSMNCLTVSTACLGAHFVVGSKTYIGFGDERVSRYIRADRYRERCRHEMDLRRLCAL